MERRFDQHNGEAPPPLPLRYKFILDQTATGINTDDGCAKDSLKRTLLDTLPLFVSEGLTGVLLWVKRRKRKLGNGMEIARNLAIHSEKSINFGKSSGGKQEESHLRKLDTNEISRKNYLTKYFEEKSFSSFKTITKSEFRRRKSFFENFSQASDLRTERPDQTLKALLSKDKRAGAPFPKGGPETLYLYRFPAPGNECRSREKEMAHKLEEIHQMVRRMQKIAENLDGGRGYFPSEKIRQSRKTFTHKEEERENLRQKKNFTEWKDTAFSSLRRSTTKSSFGTAECLKFETSCKLKQKLIPSQFMSSFETELGSTGKSFTEQIIFQTRFVPDIVTDGTAPPRKFSGRKPDSINDGLIDNRFNF